MIKILHIGEYLQGGVATYVRTLLENSYVEFDEYIICADSNSNHVWDTPPNKVFYYQYERSITNILPAVYAIHKCIKEIKPDIIYCHSTWAGVFARAPYLLIARDVRIIYNAHGWAFLRDTSEWKKKLYAFVERILLSATDKVVNVSMYEYNAALKYGLSKSKLAVVYSGISEKETISNINVSYPVNKINILFVGRFDKPKGIDYLLREFSKCKRTDLHLTVIGDNVVGDSQVIEKQDTDKITFRGWVPHHELASYYKGCDVVIMPSRWEAFGLVAVEAMKYKKPVIVSDRGALPELIKDQVNGYVFDFDNPESLQQLFYKLDSNKLACLGETARNIFIKSFQQKNMIKKTVSIYKDLMDKR